MGFFDEDTDENAEIDAAGAELLRHRPPEWSCPPENEVPAHVGGTWIVGRSDDAAVLIGHIAVFSTGWLFTLRTAQRPGSYDVFSGDDPFGTFGSRQDTGLLFGIGFSDGTRVTLSSRYTANPNNPPTLLPQGGGGSAGSWEQEFWCWPLPPAGPIRIVTVWGDTGIEESQIEIDGSAIRAAADRVVELWEDNRPFADDDEDSDSD